MGYDKEHNVISLQMIGRLDTHGLMPCMRNSDLYVLRIAESEGVMNLIRFVILYIRQFGGCFCSDSVVYLVLFFGEGMEEGLREARVELQVPLMGIMQISCLE